jgi:hypothetical protein
MDTTQFVELFRPLPGNHYLQVTTEVDATTFALAKMMQEVGGEFHLVLYTQEEFIVPKGLEDVKVQCIKELHTPFRALPRDHDVVVYKDIYTQHANPESLLRVAYTTLANTADVIIMEKKGRCNTQELQEKLEDFEFRAPNTIDLLDQYDLVMAKKMHMWGNGL